MKEKNKLWKNDYFKGGFIVIAFVAITVGLVFWINHSNVKNPYNDALLVINIGVIGIIYFLYRLTKNDKLVKRKIDNKFFKFYYIFILLITIFGIIESIFNINLIIDAALTWSTFVLSIVAIRNFKRNKSPPITRLLPICYLIFAGIAICISIITVVLYLTDTSISEKVLTSIITIVDYIFSIFTLILSAYVIKKFILKK